MNIIIFSTKKHVPENLLLGYSYKNTKVPEIVDLYPIKTAVDPEPKNYVHDNRRKR